MNEKGIFISVMGTMGSGKTTAAKLLAQKLTYTLMTEHYEENNFLPRFYDDMKRWAFHSQTFFLLEKVRQLEQIPELLLTNSIIQDTPIIQDVYSYAQAQYKLNNMDHEEWKLYRKTYESLNGHLRQPDFIVYLDASVDTIMERIANRGREYEQSIPRSYIELLDKLNAEWLETTTIPVVKINTNSRNFVHKELDQEFFTISVRHAIAQYR